ncbi:MAG: family 16 glycoside hydrolase [Candidatus Binataceae bacterium]
MADSAWLRISATITGATIALTIGAHLAFAAPSAPAAPPAPAASPAPTPAPNAKVWNFDRDEAGRMPAEWKSIAGDWKVIPDPTAPSKPNAFGLPPGRLLTSLVYFLEYYPRAILESPTDYSNFTYSAEFKPPAEGAYHLDCSGGLIFRYVDDKDYYLLSAGCPSDDFALTRIAHGKTTVLKRDVRRVSNGEWAELKVTADGPHLSCFLNDKLVFEVDDSKIEAGKIGLWARDDSQARFDDVTLTLPTAAAPAVGAAAPALPALPPPPPPLPH